MEPLGSRQPGSTTTGWTGQEMPHGEVVTATVEAEPRRRKVNVL